MLGIRDRYTIDPDNGQDLHAHGNFVDHEYEIERDGETIATISKKWFRVRDTYGVEIGAGENQAFLLRSHGLRRRDGPRLTLTAQSPCC